MKLSFSIVLIIVKEKLDVGWAALRLYDPLKGEQP